MGDILHFLTPSVGRDSELVATTSSSASVSASVSASSAVSSTDDAEESQRPKDDHVSFIWASEKTDFNHLYLITVRIPQVGFRCPIACRENVIAMVFRAAMFAVVTVASVVEPVANTVNDSTCTAT